MRDNLKAFFTNHWKYLAVSTACRLNIFDHLINPKTPKQLAKELELDENNLTLLLEALYSVKFLSKSGDLFFNSPYSEYLTEDNPESLKFACMNWSSEHLTAYQNLDFSIKTGKNSFEQNFGMPYFCYLRSHPEKMDSYQKAMYEYAKDDYRDLPNVIDFSIHNAVIDVGGGYGAALEFIKDSSPHVKCILFDLEAVIKGVKNSNIETYGGNFFEEIPKQADALLMCRILHDWDNEKANRILLNCYKSLPSGGTLYIIENCKDKTKDNLQLLSLNMMAMCESYERSSIEYITLAESAGFNYLDNVKLNELQNVLIFTRNEMG